MSAPSQPPPPAPAPDEDSAAALRRQLILAQIQLMELEDARDDLASRLAASHDLLAQAQEIADRALAESDRAAAERRGLEADRSALQASVDALHAALAAAGQREAALAARLAEQGAQLAAHDQARRDAEAIAAARATRLAALEAERQTMKSSRSWRYTAPLRSLERALRRRGGSSA
jgi:chromosome segregation ATPase